MRWLKEGDVNNVTFHRTINRGGVEIGFWGKGAVFEHFHSHFKKREGVRLRMPMELVKAWVEEKERDGLVNEFTEEEVRDAVWECEDSKSPGPDGFNFGFLKACCNTIKEDIF